MRFCEALADSIIQQLLVKPMFLLQNANYNLSESEYSAMEVQCFRLPAVNCNNASYLTRMHRCLVLPSDDLLALAHRQPR